MITKTDQRLSTSSTPVERKQSKSDANFTCGPILFDEDGRWTIYVMIGHQEMSWVGYAGCGDAVTLDGFVLKENSSDPVTLDYASPCG